MTTQQKAALVEAAWEAHGLNRALTAVDLPKSTWYYQRTQKVSYEDKYAHLQGALEEIARKHPEYGILRTTEELRDSYGRVVNHKVVQRLHQLWNYWLLRSTRRLKPSTVRQAITSAGSVQASMPVNEPIWQRSWKRLGPFRWRTLISLNCCMQTVSEKPI
jgi:hypothetical protein